jgi:CHASE2 domain-containing sensor protein
MALRLFLLGLAIILSAYRLTEHMERRSASHARRCVRICSTSFCLVMGCSVGYLSAGWSIAIPASIIGVILGYALANVYDDIMDYIEERIYEDQEKIKSERSLLPQEIISD